MKREAHNHPKMLDLAARLRITPTHARGVMETLWNWCADFAPQGNIGKWADGTIAKVCDWDGEPEMFVLALTESGWLDRCLRHRLVVHDLEHHAPDWWKTKLKRLNLEFIKTVHPSHVSEANARANGLCERSRERSGELAPDPDSENPTSENPTSGRLVGHRSGSASGFDVSVVTKETLQSLDRLEAWYRHDLKRSDSIVEGSEHCWHNVQAAAAKALNAADVNDPVAVFKWIVRGRRWGFISATHDDIAKAMRRRERPVVSNGRLDLGGVLKRAE